MSTLLAVSCLDLDPKDQLADGNLWQRQDDFTSFSNQFYSWTKNFNMVYDGYIHSDKRSDILADKQTANVYSNGTNTVPESDGDYTGGYSHIRRCNILIEKAQGYANQQDISQPLGEAYFFRAYCYFELMQKFGDLIIVTKPIDVNDEAMNAKRNDRKEVTDLIVNDLRQAASLLPKTQEVKEGRIGKEGAMAFLSRVALYEGTWQKFRGNTERGVELLKIAKEAAKDVIDSKQFALFKPVALGDSAQKYMFILEDTKCNGAGLTKKDNKEYIFKTCYDETLRPINLNITRECLGNVQIVSAKFASMYLCQDGLPIDKSPLFKGYDEVGSEYESRDKRMQYTMMRPGDCFWSNVNPRTDWSSSPEEKAKAEKKNWLPNQGTGYFHQKWATERKVENKYESYDYPIIRYAEVLLNYAEAAFEIGETISDEDLNISLNLTRQRVNAKMPKLSNAFVHNNGLDMRQEIRRERTIELFQEGFRIDDLKRWKTAETEMPMDFLGIRWQGQWKQKWANPGKPLNQDGRLIWESGRQWQEKHYLYPLPIDQLQLNPNLNQNPGWAK